LRREVQRMEKTKVEIAIFFCTHLRERVQGVLKASGGSGGADRFRPVPLPCSGKLEVFQLTRALETGADGVALFGCPERACRYQTGSSRARGRVEHTAKILEEIGLGKDRVRRFVMENQPEQDLRQDFSGWVEKVRGMDRRGKDPGGQISNSLHS
jgi:coenzyme F420-reducing hydrogenase delta subunit